MRKREKVYLSSKWGPDLKKKKKKESAFGLCVVEVCPNPGTLISFWWLLRKWWWEAGWTICKKIESTPWLLHFGQ